MHTTESHPRSRAPRREVIAFTAITFALSVAVSMALPDADVNMILTMLAPVAAVAILTFTMFRRGTRRELWRSTGVGRTGAHTWGSAFGLPVLRLDDEPGVLGRRDRRRDPRGRRDRGGRAAHPGEDLAGTRATQAKPQLSGANHPLMTARPRV